MGPQLDAQGPIATRDALFCTLAIMSSGGRLSTSMRAAYLVPQSYTLQCDNSERSAAFSFALGNENEGETDRPCRLGLCGSEAQACCRGVEAASPCSCRICGYDRHVRHIRAAAGARAAVGDAENIHGDAVEGSGGAGDVQETGDTGSG